MEFVPSAFGRGAAQVSGLQGQGTLQGLGLQKLEKKVRGKKRSQISVRDPYFFLSFGKRSPLTFSNDMEFPAIQTQFCENIVRFFKTFSLEKPMDSLKLQIARVLRDASKQ